MELLLGEHGEAVRSCIIGSFVLMMLFIAINLLSEMMPEYCTKKCLNSMGLHEEIKNNSPKILADDVIYVAYEKKILIADYIKAMDADGTELTEKIICEGEINTSKKGLYIVLAKVTNDLGYSDEKRIRVLVE